MKFSRFFFTTIVALTYTFTLSAQNDALSVGLRINMGTAIKSFESRDSVFFDPQLAAELTENYCQRYVELTDPKFGIQEKAKDLFNFYSTPEGMEEILAAWNNRTNTSMVMLPIGNVLAEYLFLSISTNTVQQPEDKVQPQNAPNISTDKSAPSPIDKNSAIRNRQRELPANRSASTEVRVREKLNQENIPDKPNERIAATGFRNKATTVETRLSIIYSPKQIEAMRLTAIHQLQLNALHDTLANQKMMMLSADTPNKYAKLLVNEPEMTDAEIYLDGKMIAPVKKIKKGILVHSKQKYLYEINSFGEKLCGDTITLAPREEKTIICED